MTLVIRFPAVDFGDNAMELAAYDTMASTGTMFLYDFANTKCWDGTAFDLNDVPVNLKPGGGLNGKVVTAASYSSSPTGAMGPLGVIQLSPTNVSTDYDPGTLGLTNWAWICWCTVPATVTALSGTGKVHQNGVEAIYGLQVNTSRSVTAMVKGQEAAANFTPTADVMYQYAVAMEGSVKTVYRNGALVLTINGATAPAASPNSKAYIGYASGGYANWPGKTSRVLMENLTLAGRTAAAFVAKDWADNHTRHGV
ncbi:LamG-like jellyroll fold domain-containing protein [Caulobacter sp. 1776]|uniref:LamG-like jellyroll fold domain-containing protein n=1 Tax=Caulobacter sp. 1776 TaxID=3156420 RepID=UPI00339B759B